MVNGCLSLLYKFDVCFWIKTILSKGWLYYHSKLEN